MKKKVTVGAGLLVAAGLLFSLGTAVVDNVYAALSSISPSPTDVDAGGIDGGMSHLIKKEDVATVTTLRLAAYYPQSSGGNGSNKTLSLRYGINGKKCLIINDIVNKGGNVHVRIAGTTTKHYKIPIARVCDDLRNAQGNIRTNVEDNGGNGWTNNKFFADYPFPNDMVWDERVRRYKVDITISYGDNVEEGKSDQNSVNFITDVNGSGEIGPLANESPNELGYRSAYFRDTPARSAHVSAQFTIPCDATKNKFEVRLYDPDENVFGDTYLWVTANGSRLPKSRYDESQNRRINGWSGTQQAWLAGAGSDNFSRVTVVGVERGETYRFHIRNDVTAGKLSPNYNVLSLGIPYDSIPPSGVNCNYELNPTITLNSSNTYVYYPDANVRGGVTKSGAGIVPENHPWEIYAVRYSSQPNTDLTNADVGGPACNYVPATNRIGGCQSLTNPALNYPGSSSSVRDYNSGGPDPVGTRVCFFTRVQNPTDSFNDDDSWRYSDMVCAVSAKKPRVQFLGSDVRVAGNATSSYFTVQGNHYGSWAEYGMFVSGINSMVASGNALRSGNPDNTLSNWNKLTFANTPSYGGYTPLPAASSAYAYFTGLPRQNGDSLNAATIPNGVYDMTGKSVGATLKRLGEAKGGGTILIANGDFKVTRVMAEDTFPMNENLTSAKDITQLVIVANNITIDPDVSRLNAWLITPANGSINTCSGSDPLTSNICNTPLTINGPIFTGRLILRRTAGGNPPDSASLSEPAERFNLRPDAQLWSYLYANKADYAQTDYVQELPPRY